MARITIQITDDNAAFEDSPTDEIRNVLGQACRWVLGDLPDDSGGPYRHTLRDTNGNTCGHVMIE